MKILKIIKTSLVLAIALTVLGNESAHAMRYHVNQQKSPGQSTRSQNLKKNGPSHVLNAHAERNLWLNQKYNAALTTIKRLKRALAGTNYAQYHDQHGREFSVDAQQALEEIVRRAEEDRENHENKEASVRESVFMFENDAHDAQPDQETKKSCMSVLQTGVVAIATSPVTVPKAVYRFASENKKLILVLSLMAGAAYIHAPTAPTCKIYEDQSHLVGSLQNQIQGLGTDLARAQEDHAYCVSQLALDNPSRGVVHTTNRYFNRLQTALFGAQ